MVISDLRSAPEFADTIAHRGWNAWWTNSGMSLDAYRQGMEPMIRGYGIPSAFVAHENGHYLGSVLLIESDLEEKPALAPWIAALWVEPDARRRGVAERLIAAARQEAGKHGHPTCYLCATAENSPYYLARGFRLVESDVEGVNIFDIASLDQPTV